MDEWTVDSLFNFTRIKVFRFSYSYYLTMRYNWKQQWIEHKFNLFLISSLAFLTTVNILEIINFPCYLFLRFTALCVQTNDVVCWLFSDFSGQCHQTWDDEFCCSLLLRWLHLVWNVQGLWGEVPERLTYGVCLELVLPRLNFHPPGSGWVLQKKYNIWFSQDYARTSLQCFTSLSNASYYYYYYYETQLFNIDVAIG